MAWAVVKMLLPVRLVVCVWATPWFARVVVLPVTRVMGRFVGKSSISKVKNPANGTNAVGGGTVPKRLDTTIVKKEQTTKP
jgi:hypothetical protein